MRRKIQTHLVQEISIKTGSVGQVTAEQSSQIGKLSQSLLEQIMVKNIDSGNYEIFDNQQVFLSHQIKQLKFPQTSMSLWDSYWQEISKIDLKLFKLVLNKDAQMLKRLLTQQPIQLNNFKYMDGWTLLHHAVVSSSKQIIQMLIQHKIDVNVCSNEMKRTPMHQAVLSNRIEIVQLLIKSGVDLNVQDLDGNTPVHYAAQLSYQQIFEQMVKSCKKVDFFLRNHQQMSILNCIRQQKLYRLVQSLYPQVISQNQNLPQNTENRRVVRFLDNRLIKRYSKSDMIEKFLDLRNANQNSWHTQTIIAGQQSEASNGCRKSHQLLGRKPSHWISKKGKVIASQSICLMKQSILDFEQSQNQGFQSLANFDILRFIGSGGFAQVFLARKKRSSKLFALKRINKSKILQNNLKRYVYSERNLMIKCHHPFIVQAHSMFQDQAHLYITMEYCECGDLQKVIQSRGRFSEDQAKIYAAQVGLALEQIHSKNIIFRDLKAANVLMAKDGYVKISDFGLAKQSIVSFSFLGSVQYLAPEMLVDHQMKEHTKSIDWYLFGVLIYELVTGRPPFYGEKQHILFKKIRQQMPVFPGYLSKQCRSLLSKLLQKDPRNRLGSKKDFQQIKNEEWFKIVQFQKLIKKQYELSEIQQVIDQKDLRKKMSIDDFVTNEKYEYFKQWNYVRQ